MNNSGSSSSLDSILSQELSLDALSSKVYWRKRTKAYRKVILDVADALDKDDVEKIVWRCRLPHNCKEKTPVAVLDLLHERGELSETKPNELKEMLEEINRHQLVHSYVEPFLMEFHGTVQSEHDQHHSLSASSNTQSELSQDQHHLLTVSRLSDEQPCHSLTSCSNTRDQSELSQNPRRETHYSFESDESVLSTDTNESDESNFPQTMHMSLLKHQAMTSSDDPVEVSSQSNRRHSLDQLSGITDDKFQSSRSSKSLRCSQCLPTTSMNQSYRRETPVVYAPIKSDSYSNQYYKANLRTSTIDEDHLGAVNEQTPTIEGVVKRRPQSSDNSRAVKRQKAFRRRFSAPPDSSPHNERHLVRVFSDTNQSNNSEHPHRLTSPNEINGYNTPCGATVTVHNTYDCENKSSQIENSQLGISDDGEYSSNKIIDNQFQNCETLLDPLDNLTIIPKEELSDPSHQPSKRSVLSVIKSSLIRPKVIASKSSGGLVWTESIERIQKYVYSRKLRNDAITCSSKLEVDGMGYPNPKLLLHIYPYGMEEDQNKEITMEVEIELHAQKKARLPTGSKLELKVIIESKENTHNSLSVEEDIRLQFFYVKKIISHELLKSLDCKDIIIRVHAKLILPKQ